MAFVRLMARKLVLERKLSATQTWARGGGATGFLTLRPHFLTDLAVIFMTRPRSIKKIGSASPENMIYGKNLILNQIFF